MDTGTDHHVDNRRKDHAGDRSILLSRYPHPTSPMPDRYVVGDVIAGRYDVLAVHKGGMGIVYATFDSKARLPRALKTLQERFAANPAALDLFEEEAAVWVRMEKHPSIVRAYSVQRIEGLPYVIAEYVRGPRGMGSDLTGWLGHPRLTAKVAISLALQIAQAMKHATNKVPGFVHRDLKPANVLVDDRVRALVTDFGLVYATDTDAGTPAYMAPEQWRRAELDQRTDIYAYGCILYEMFSAQRVFPAATNRDKEIRAELVEFVRGQRVRVDVTTAQSKNEATPSTTPTTAMAQPVVEQQVPEPVEPLDNTPDGGPPVTTTPAHAGTDIPGLRAAYGEDTAVRNIIDHFASRQYNQNTTELDTLRNKLEHSGTPVEEPGLIRALRRLDALGVGRFLLGRRGQPTRFEWHEKSLTVRSLATDEPPAESA